MHAVGSISVRSPHCVHFGKPLARSKFGPIKASRTRLLVSANLAGDRQSRIQTNASVTDLAPAPSKAEEAEQSLAEEFIAENIEPLIADIMAPFKAPQGPWPIEEMQIDGDKTGQVVRVPSDFAAEEGLRITDDLVVGKMLGGGVQGAVYLLNNPDGKDSGQLLKVMKYKAATPITGLDIGLKREWLIGQQLNQLADSKGQLQGYMKTGAAIVNSEDLLEGLIIEKVNGWPLEKRLWKDEQFADAPYALTMLTQVFSAMDMAYKKIGFVHRDMRVANIVEYRPEGTPWLPEGFISKEEKKSRKKLGYAAEKFQLPGEKKARVLQFKIIDYGHARLVGPQAPQKLPVAPVMEKWYRSMFRGKGDVWRLLQDLGEAIDGRTWPDQQHQEVSVLLGLIKEVTGVGLNAFYKPTAESLTTAAAPASTNDTPSRSQQLTMAKLPRSGLPWQMMGGFGHSLRRVFIRARVYALPRRPDFSATDALEYLDKEKKKTQ